MEMARHLGLLLRLLLLRPVWPTHSLPAAPSPLAQLPPQLLPTPPRQTPEQAELMNRIRTSAAEASAAARPQLLAIFDDPQFRTAFAPLVEPSTSSLSSTELLQLFEEEIAVAEIVHNMPADVAQAPGGPDDKPKKLPAPDNTIALGRRSPVFWNLWEVGLMTGAREGPQWGPSVNCSTPDFRSKLHCENNTDPHIAGSCKWVELENRCVSVTRSFENPTNAAEVGLFGLPSFRNNQQRPANFADAVQRPVYTAVNHHKVDLGNPNFGPVGVVFSRQFNDNMTLVGAVDTGMWEMQCNHSLGFPQGRPAGQRIDTDNCSFITSQQECNDGHATRVGCDWRDGECVDTLLSRQECSAQHTATDCAAATGLNPFKEERAASPFMPPSAEEILWNAGCSWDAEQKVCRPFACNTSVRSASPQACSQPHPAPVRTGEHCTWNSNTNQCERLTAQMICGNVDKFAPPGSSLADRCNNIAQGNMCRIQKGQCLPLDCNSVADEATCNWENVTMPLPHCAWQPSGKCVDFAGDCTRLHVQDSCARLEAYGVCRWDTAASRCVSGRGPMVTSVDCTGWPNQTLGTMDHNMHILLANARTWNQSSPAINLAKLLARVFAPERNPITPEQIFQYWEANIVGAPLYPSAVRLLIGNFAELFGTRLGESLQMWCKDRRWPLVWALGTGTASTRMGSAQAPGLYFNRSLDPTVLSAMGSNITFPSEVGSAFAKLWTGVKSARAVAPPPSPPAPGHPPPSSALPLADVLAAWNALPTELAIESLSSRSCDAGSQCVGVRTVDRDCVCNDAVRSNA